MGQPIDVLVIPFRFTGDGSVVFAVMLRRGTTAWQLLAGSSRDGGTPEDGARQALADGLGLVATGELVALDSTIGIEPSAPERVFGAQVEGPTRRLSGHDAVAWLRYDDASARLRERHRDALRALRDRLTGDAGLG